jgi:hypothetical protein
VTSATAVVSTRPAVVYLVAQAAAVLAWWVAVIASQAVRGWFFPYGALDPAFIAFLVPDLVLIVGGSLVVARRKARGDPTPRAAGALLGAVGYGALYTLAWTVLLQAPAAGLVAMLVVAAGTWRACR